MMLALAGCANTVPVNPITPNPDVTIEKVDGGAMFSVLADLLPSKAGEVADGAITDLKTLQRAVKIHRDHGWITSDVESKFDAKFSGANRQLTPDDAATLRGLK